MKNGKKPTRKQKFILDKFKLKVDEWLVTKDTPEELHLIHKTTNKCHTVRDGQLL